MGLDIVRVEHRQAAFHAVDQHKRAAAVHRERSADVDGSGTVGAAVAGRNIDGGVGSLQGVDGRNDGTLVQHRAVHDTYRTGKRALFLCTEPYHNDLIEEISRIIKYNVVRSTLVSGQIDFRIGISDVRDDDPRREPDRGDLIGAVLVCNITFVSPGDFDGGSGKGFARRIRHGSPQGILRLYRKGDNEQKKIKNGYFFHIAWLSFLPLEVHKIMNNPTHAQDGQRIFKVSIKTKTK